MKYLLSLILITLLSCGTNKEDVERSKKMWADFEKIKTEKDFLVKAQLFQSLSDDMIYFGLDDSHQINTYLKTVDIVKERNDALDKIKYESDREKAINTPQKSIEEARAELLQEGYIYHDKYPSQYVNLITYPLAVVEPFTIFHQIRINNCIAVSNNKSYDVYTYKEYYEAVQKQILKAKKHILEEGDYIYFLGKTKKYYKIYSQRYGFGWSLIEETPIAWRMQDAENKRLFFRDLNEISRYEFVEIYLEWHTVHETIYQYDSDTLDKEYKIFTELFPDMEFTLVPEERKLYLFCQEVAKMGILYNYNTEDFLLKAVKLKYSSGECSAMIERFSSKEKPDQFEYNRMIVRYFEHEGMQ